MSETCNKEASPPLVARQGRSCNQAEMLSEHGNSCVNDAYSWFLFGIGIIVSEYKCAKKQNHYRKKNILLNEYFIVVTAIPPHSWRGNGCILHH